MLRTLKKANSDPTHADAWVPRANSKNIILCVLSGCLLTLSFPNFNLWFLSWFGFVPLFFALRNKSKLQAFFLAYLTGVIFWSGTIYWLAHVTLPGLIVLVLYLALYFGIFGLVFSFPDLRLTTYDILSISSMWVILEYLRSHLFTGFPWALLGYSQYINLPIIQIADITGVWGVSFLVMMVNVAVYKVISYKLRVKSGKQKSSYRPSILLPPLILLLLSLIYGFYKLSYTLTASAAGGSLPVRQAGASGGKRSTLKISVIQPNISQELKWQENLRGFILDRHISLTQEAIKDNPDLVIWPEAAVPAIWEEVPSYQAKISSFVKESRIPLLLGVVSYQDSAYYNSAILFSKDLSQMRYDKIHLVPFGEYIPLKRFLPFLETVVPIGDFTPGKEYTVFTLPMPPLAAPRHSAVATYYLLPTKFSVLICFEDVFPELARDFVKRGAKILVNITNDAWFKKTGAPYQHLQASVFRAVENRVPVVRSANTGVSGFISPSGEIIALVKDNYGNSIFTSGYSTQEISIQDKKTTFYTRYGDIIIIVLFIVAVYSFKTRSQIRYA